MNSRRIILSIIILFLWGVFSSYAQTNYKERFGQHVLVGENELVIVQFGISFKLRDIEIGNRFIKVEYQYTNNTTDSVGVYLPDEDDAQHGILDIVMDYNDGIQDIYKPLDYTSDLSRILFLKNHVKILAPQESLEGTFLINKKKTLLAFPSMKLKKVHFEFNFRATLISEFHRIFAPLFLVSNTLEVQTSKGRR